MGPRTFQLTARGIEQAILFEDKDFTFIVGGSEYPCTRFQACFFSKRVARMVAGDRTIDRFCLESKDGKGQFRDIVCLMNGESIEITPENSAFLESCARELENDELLGSILWKLDHEQLLPSNVVERIKLKRAFTQKCDREIVFAATHFSEVDVKALWTLPITDLELIVTSSALKLESEDQLFEIIHGLVNEKGKEYAVLLRHVQFQFLSSENLDTFLGLIFPDVLDASLWRLVHENLRLVCDARNQEALHGERYELPEKIREHQKDKYVTCSCPSAFTGIMSYLRERCNGNVHDKGIVEITSSSSDYSQCHRLVDYGWGNSWRSKDEPNSYVQFDFKDNRVALTGYSIKSDGSGWRHLCNWVIEASVNGEKWEVLDSRNTKDLCGKYIVKTYQCNHRSDELWRFFRLRQTGSNSSGNNYLYLSEIEFFGTLKHA